MKIMFVISSRMPTEKAYGVTMINTAEVLVQQGIDNEIWSISDSLQAFYPLRPFGFSRRYISILRKCFSSTFQLVRKLAYLVNAIRVSISSAKRLVGETEFGSSKGANSPDDDSGINSTKATFLFIRTSSYAESPNHFFDQRLAEISFF